MTMRKMLPNLLSAARILLALFILAIYSNSTKSEYLTSLGIIGLALVTDFADGLLARKWDVTSVVGYVLDGLGDRAVYIALILLLVERYDVPLYIAWLFVFRDVAIYALRSLHDDWYPKRRELRRFSRMHAGGIRLWFLSYLVADGARLFDLFEASAYDGFRLTQNLIAIATIAVAYYSLYLQMAPIVAAPYIKTKEH